MGDASCGPADIDGNFGLAFGLVTAAGLSTTIGAAAAFLMPYSSDGKNLFLAASLAVASGVMLYVSFIEIFAVKAVEDFEACYDRRFAYLYATLCFFGGVLLTYLFDRALHIFEGFLVEKKSNRAAKRVVHSDEQSSSSSSAIVDTQNSNDVELQNDSVQVAETPVDAPIEIYHDIGHDGHMVANMYTNNSKDSKALIRMGIFAGIALAFHNFPEGLATFIAVLEDPSVGASVAVAIGIHNIPEGICVAMPIYYATGSRWKAFFWATMSGMTELLGAFLGWIVLRKVLNRVVYGALFGIVAGMMVYIALKELLPTAHRYDPEDKVTTFGLVAGMGIMALSLVLFEF